MVEPESDTVTFYGSNDENDRYLSKTTLRPPSCAPPNVLLLNHVQK